MFDHVIFFLAVRTTFAAKRILKHGNKQCDCGHSRGKRVNDTTVRVRDHALMDMNALLTSDRGKLLYKLLTYSYSSTVCVRCTYTLVNRVQNVVVDLQSYTSCSVFVLHLRNRKFPTLTVIDYANTYRTLFIKIKKE